MSKSIFSFSQANTTNTQGNWKDDDGGAVEAAPSTAEFSGQGVGVVLGDLLPNLLEWIRRFDAIVGCVAWLTNESVLRALNAKSVAQIVMQKEDWLRPDYDGTHPARKSRGFYDKDSGASRHSFGGCFLSYLGDYGLPRYRVFGVVNSERPSDRPVMHHKFLVGGRMKSGPEGRNIDNDQFVPESAWVGSFNMSKGSVRNLDSALILGPEPARAYFLEWRDVLIHSEPLDFMADYVEPEWRIGS